MSDPVDWQQLLRTARAMIGQVNSEQQVIDSWSLGGGTAMMLQINHRESRDIDIFLPDAQFLSFLDPQMHDFDFEIPPTDYAGDGARFLKLVFDAGEIDFIVSQTLTSSPATQATVEGEAVLLETIPEIITKKICHRGTSIMPRDIFDIAAASETHSDVIVRELRSYRNDVAMTLAAMDRQNPDFVERVISQLMVKDAYAAIASHAIEKARDVLEAV